MAPHFNEIATEHLWYYFCIFERKNIGQMEKSFKKSDKMGKTKYPD